jgi:hypothetical protein
LPLLKEVAQELEEGAEKSLFKARERLVALSLGDLQSESPRDLFVAYVLNKVIRDVWANLGTDAMFDFPDSETMSSIAKNLGKFVKNATSERNEDFRVACLAAAEAVSAYYRLVDEYELKAQEGELPESEAEVGD